MINVGLFGAGRIGQIHARNLASLAGVKLAKIYDPLTNNAEKLATEFGCKLASVDDIINDKSIEAVVIASPTETHSELIKRSAKANKKIFCEKPVDLSAEQAQDCANVVNSCGVPCMIGFNRRFDPTFNSAKKRILNGEIGALEMLIIISRDPEPPPASYLKSSGGVFRDMLIHDFDMFLWLFCEDDEPVWISAAGSYLTDSKIGDIDDIDLTIVNIRTKKGRLAQINTSRRAIYGYDQRFEVLGSKGLIQCANHKPTEVIKSDINGVTMDKPEYFFLERYARSYRLEIEHFFSCLQNGQPFLTTINDGVRAQKLADAATKSWKMEQAINL